MLAQFSTELLSTDHPLKVEFLVVAPHNLWQDAGFWCASDVPNTLDEVFDKYPGFVNQLANKCVDSNEVDGLVEVHRVITSPDVNSVHTLRVTVHELMLYAETSTF
jgi:hypothetical protein